MLNSISHIRQNFGLYGFGTPELAVIQSFKTLLDNSLFMTYRNPERGNSFCNAV